MHHFEFRSCLVIKYDLLATRIPPASRTAPRFSTPRGGPLPCRRRRSSLPATEPSNEQGNAQRPSAFDGNAEVLALRRHSLASQIMASPTFPAISPVFSGHFP